MPESNNDDSPPQRVILFSDHMVDRPERVIPGFTLSAKSWLRTQFMPHSLDLERVLATSPSVAPQLVAIFYLLK
jgi:hypothetical protein